MAPVAHRICFGNVGCASWKFEADDDDGALVGAMVMNIERESLARICAKSLVQGRDVAGQENPVALGGFLMQRLSILKDGPIGIDSAGLTGRKDKGYDW